MWDITYGDWLELAKAVDDHVAEQKKRQAQQKARRRPAGRRR